LRALEEDLIAHLLDVNVGNAGHHRRSSCPLPRPTTRNDQYLAISQKARPFAGKTGLSTPISRRSRRRTRGNAETRRPGRVARNQVRSEHAGRSERGLAAAWQAGRLLRPRLLLLMAGGGPDGDGRRCRP
jgi:hypothetical protein